MGATDLAAHLHPAVFVAETLTGMDLLGQLPHTGDVATGEDWRWEVVDMDAKRADKILAGRIANAEENTH